MSFRSKCMFTKLYQSKCSWKRKQKHPIDSTLQYRGDLSQTWTTIDMLECDEELNVQQNNNGHIFNDTETYQHFVDVNQYRKGICGMTELSTDAWFHKLCDNYDENEQFHIDTPVIHNQSPSPNDIFSTQVIDNAIRKRLTFTRHVRDDLFI